MKKILLIVSIIAASKLLDAQTNLGYNPTYAGTGNGCIAGGNCFYIDIINGNDSNAGNSKAAAWAHAPGMACATSTAAGHPIVQHDEYIFKGGETWPASCFAGGWSISGSFASPNSYAYPGIYIGYDPTWNTGLVNSIRVIDPGNCSNGEASITGLSWSSGIETVTSALNPGSGNQVVLLNNYATTSPQVYSAVNGTYTVLSSNSSSFTFGLTSNPGSVAAYGQASGIPSLSVTFSGGGGSGVVGTANMEVIDSIFQPSLLSFVTLTNQGTGYTSNPTLSFAITTGSCTKLPTAYADIYSPVFSASGTTMGIATNVPPMLNLTANYTTIDHIEIGHFHIYSNADYTFTGSPVMVNLQGTSLTARNLYLHDYAMANTAGFNTFCVINSACQQIDAAQSAALAAYAEGGISDTVTNNLFNNYEAEAMGCASGALYYNNCEQFTALFSQPYSGTSVGAVITNNIFNNWRGVIYTTGDEQNNLVAGNKVWAALHDVGTQHGDTFYLESGGIAYNNILRDTYNGTASFYVENVDGASPTAYGFTNYLFNNVVWDIGTSTPPIGWSSEYMTVGVTSISPAHNMKALNNTFYSNLGTADCINSGQWFHSAASLSSSFNFTLYNNQCVSTQSAQHWYNSNDDGTHPPCATTGCGIWNGNANPNTTATRNLVDPPNVIDTPTSTASQGYAPSNNFAPTLPSNDTVTFASGGNSQNLTSLCSTTVNGLSLANLCYDILGNARPGSGGWQAGAYQFTTGATQGSGSRAIRRP